jgi:siroheme synthase
MGVTNLRRIALELVESGRHEETPVALIRWGTYETQRTVTGTLANIADLVEREGLRAPAVIVVGEVVRLRDELTWFETNVPARLVINEELAEMASLLV